MLPLIHLSSSSRGAQRLETRSHRRVERQFDADFSNPDDLVTACRRFGAAAKDLDDALKDDECPYSHLVETRGLAACLAALRSNGLLEPEREEEEVQLPELTEHDGSVSPRLASRQGSLSATKSVSSKGSMRDVSATQVKVVAAQPSGKLHPTPKGSRDLSSGAAPPAAASPWHPQTGLATFIDAYAAATNSGGDEFRGLVNVFLTQLSNGSEGHQAAQTGGEGDAADDDNDPLDMAAEGIEVVGKVGTAAVRGAMGAVRGKRWGLMMGDGTPGPSRANLYPYAPLSNLVERMTTIGSGDTYQTVACARILRVILEDAHKTGDLSLLRARQTALNNFGVSGVVLRLVSCETNELYKAGLELGVMMLKEGCRPVQHSVHKLLANRSETDTAAIDGSETSFFMHIRDK